jgi:CRP-like cAMP-binding protein
VKLSVVARSGREGVVALLGPGDFFGEGCLAGQPVRLRQATAVLPSTIVEIDKDRMVRVLHEQSALSDRFIAHMLARNIRMEDDLVDQLFHSAEQRLARTLLLLARPRQGGEAAGAMPKITQTTLSEIIGTTRSRVNALMKHFERMGFIEYTSHELRVHLTLQAVVDAGDEQPSVSAPGRRGDSFYG